MLPPGLFCTIRHQIQCAWNEGISTRNEFCIGGYFHSEVCQNYCYVFRQVENRLLKLLRKYLPLVLHYKYYFPGIFYAINLTI